MHKDRLVFDEEKLENGIRVFFYPMDVPFSEIKISIPFGHVNNTGDIASGTFHFLEHSVLNRSKKHPEKNEFSKLVSLRGGYLNATTNLFSTDYILEIPVDIFDTGFVGLLSHIYDPLITKEDIEIESSIILNERKRKGPWWPGDNEMQYYLNRKWRASTPLELVDRLGTDESLKSMTPEYLYTIHKAYSSNRTVVFVGGRYNRNLVCQELSKIKTKDINLPQNYNKLSWSEKQYHETAFTDTHRYTYYYGGILPELNIETSVTLEFLLKYLTNNVHGMLYQWLREEKGWVYEVSHRIGLDYEGSTYWSISLPFSTPEHVQSARLQLHDKIKEALLDERKIKLELDRRIYESLFFYQTLKSVIDEADSIFYSYKKIYSEADFLSLIKECATVEKMRAAYEKYMAPSVTGEFLATPKTKN
jgi:predicted Zn-dependent peptidase